MLRLILDEVLESVGVDALVTFNVGDEVIDGDAEGANEIVGPDVGEKDGTDPVDKLLNVAPIVALSFLSKRTRYPLNSSPSFVLSSVMVLDI